MNLKRLFSGERPLIKRAFDKLGGQRVRALLAPDLDPMTQDGVRYDKQVLGHYYMPWLHRLDFLGFYRRAEAVETGSYNGMAVAPRAYILVKAVESVCALPEGDFVECGVYKGGTALLACEVITRAITSPRPQFHLFDTFSGIPETALTDAEKKSNRAHVWSDVDVETTRRNLADYAELVRFYPGYVPQTFASFTPRPVRYLHIDINTATAHRDCLEFFFPQLVDGAIVIFDDYGWPGYGDCKKAVDDYFSSKGLPLPIALMTGQAIYLHRKQSRAVLSF